MADGWNTEWVVAAQAGDTQAFARLVDKYYGMVRGLVYSKVSDWSAAEDVTQDVFLTAWTHLGRLKAPEAFLMWLRRIARNSALNWLRMRQYRRALTERNLGPVPEATGPDNDPAAAAAREECLEDIGKALRALSPKLRDAMVLFYLEGRTATECAEALGTNVDTMKKRLRLGRKRLQRYFAKRNEGDLDDLLPHKPRERQVTRVMSGLAMGPVMPELGSQAAKFGPGLWLADWWHGASFSVVKETAARTAGGAWLMAKAGATAAAVFVVGTGAVVVLASDSTPAPEQAAASAIEVAPTGTVTAAALDDLGRAPAAPIEAYILVDPALASSAANGSDLRVGDRIVRINGLPISSGVREDPRATLYGHPGTTIRLTVERPTQDGARLIEIEWVRPHVPNPFTDPPETAAQGPDKPR